MRFHHAILKQDLKGTHGFTLVESLIAATVGSLVAIMASDIVLSTIHSGAALEATQRLRLDWSRTSHFIESEVALSERVITDASLLNLTQCDPEITDTEFAFGLEVRRDLPPAIYFIRANADNSLEWNGEESLWRCGPSIDENGFYTNIITSGTSSQLTAQRLVDGMNPNCRLDITPSARGVSKTLHYKLCMRGLASYSYAQSVRTYSRISPVFSYPNTNSLCSDEYLTIEGFYKLAGGTANAELRSLPSIGLTEYDDILICGYGGGDTIHGSTANDVLEAGDSGERPEQGAEINAYGGSDRLLGGPGNDTLMGGGGDDVLMGSQGDDLLEGGPGDNQYLAGSGANTITGGNGLDVVFLDQQKGDISDLSECDRTTCVVNYTLDGIDSSVTASNIEVLIFRDGRHDISSE